MKSLGFLFFVATLTVSFRVNAVEIDRLPAVPYALYPLINVAKLQLPSEEFMNAIEIDPKKQRNAILRRGGKEGQKLLNLVAKFDAENTPKTDKYFEINMDAGLASNTILFRDYNRAVFRLKGYSFDKSLIAFADDCNTLGSCAILINKIIELAQNPEALQVIPLFALVCSASSDETREKFLPPNLIRACTQIMSTAPFKAGVCEASTTFRSGVCNSTRTSRYCTETKNFFYPEFDCNIKADEDVPVFHLSKRDAAKLAGKPKAVVEWVSKMLEIKADQGNAYSAAKKALLEVKEACPDAMVKSAWSSHVIVFSVQCNFQVSYYANEKELGEILTLADRLEEECKSKPDPMAEAVGEKNKCFDGNTDRWTR